jgi:hypothetical protein
MIDNLGVFGLTLASCASLWRAAGGVLTAITNSQVTLHWSPL